MAESIPKCDLKHQQDFIEAVKARDLCTIRKLLQEGQIDVNWKDDTGMTAMHYLTGDDDLVEIAKLLVEFGADVNLEEDDGYTPLHWSSFMESHKMSAYLVSQGADVCKGPIDEHSSFIMTSKVNGGEEVHFLMLNQLGWDVRDPGAVNGWTRLHRAVLDQLYLDPNLRREVYLGDRKTIQQLVEESGGDIDVQDVFGLTALQHAVRGKLLHEDGKWMDFTKDHHWHRLDITSNLVPSKANTRLVQTLLDLGASVNCTDKQGHNALWHANFFSQDKAISLLTGNEREDLTLKECTSKWDEMQTYNMPKDHPALHIFRKLSISHEDIATTWYQLALSEIDSALQQIKKSRDHNTNTEESITSETSNSNMSIAHSEDNQTANTKEDCVTKTCSEIEHCWSQNISEAAATFVSTMKVSPTLSKLHAYILAANAKVLQAETDTCQTATTTAPVSDNQKSENEQQSAPVFRRMLETSAFNSNFVNREAVQEIETNIQHLMKRLVVKMNEMSPFLKVKVVLGGSNAENTKMGLPDEYDYRLYVGGLEGICSFVKEVGFGKGVRSWQMGSVQMRISKEADSTWLGFCDESNCLDPAKLFHHLHCTMYKALTHPGVWEGLDMYWKPHGCNAINIQWMGKEHIYHGMAIKIDVMYCVELSKWWPSYARKRTILLPDFDLDKANCCVLIKPNVLFPSACEHEKLIMGQLPKLMKTVYSVMKLINRSTYYEEMEVLTSYELKNALFYYLEQNQTGALVSDCSEISSNEPTKLKIPGNGDEVAGSKAQDREFLGPSGSEISPENVHRFMTEVCQTGLKHLRESQIFYFGMNRWLGTMKSHSIIERTIRMCKL